jgi:hypothetical protein
VSGGWGDMTKDFIDKVKFCFHEVLITIDPPHGGKTYGPAYLPGPYAGGSTAFIKSVPGVALINHATKIAEQLRRGIIANCPKHTVVVNVMVINYDKQATRDLLLESFDINGPTGVTGSAWGRDFPPTGVKDFSFARMWKNSFMYMFSGLL